MRILFLVLSLLFPIYSYSADKNNPPTLGDVAEEVTQSMQAMQYFLLETFGIVADCELNNVCIVEEVEKQANKNSDNPLWAGMSQELNSKKDEMLALDKKCNVEPANAVKKKVSLCLKQGVAKMNELQAKGAPANEPEFDIYQMENELVSCVNKEVKPLADDGNVFAIMVMIDLAKEGNDTTNWDTKLMEQKDSEYYDLVGECKSMDIL